MRDYTPRRHDAEAGTLEIDFALHEAGPATQWAEQAKVGDLLGVGGPRGSFIVPTDFDWHLLIGDDTALPAICAGWPSCRPARVQWCWRRSTARRTKSPSTPAPASNCTGCTAAAPNRAPAAACSMRCAS